MKTINELTRDHLSTLGLEDAFAHSALSDSGRYTYVWLTAQVAADRLATDFRDRGFKTEVTYSRPHQLWVVDALNG